VSAAWGLFGQRKLIPMFFPARSGCACLHPKILSLFLSLQSDNISMHGWPALSHGGIVFLYLNEERSMPIESLNSVIALGFLTVWLMVGQFSFIKN
jgi:hypothetical protein